MLRRVTWRSWAVIAVLAGAYIAAGTAYAHDAAVEMQLYRWGLLAATVAPVLLVGAYTASGNRWWANDVGSAIVQVKLCVLVLVAPLAWVFLADNGRLTPSFLAWAEVSGPALVALAMLRLCYVFLRVHRSGKKGDGDGAG